MLTASLSFVLYSCGSESVYSFCKTDPSIGDLKTRYYNITVTATDSAGHIGSDTCRVVIVPSYSSESKSGKAERYYSIDVVDASLAQSEVLYEAAQQKLTWKSGLKTSKDTAGGETKPWESDPTTNPTKSSQPSMTTLPSSQPSSSSQPKVKDATSPPSTSPTSAPSKVSFTLFILRLSLLCNRALQFPLLSQPINCKKPEAKLDTKGNCKECCSGKCNRKKTKCQKEPIG